MLHLSEGCEVRHTKFHIDAHRTYTENRGELILPRLRKFVNYHFIHKQSNVNLSNNSINHNFTQLYAQLEEIERQSKLPNSIDYHDVHHYTLIYSMIFLIATYFLFQCIRTKVNNLPTTDAISMPNLTVSLPNLSSREC